MNTKSTQKIKEVFTLVAMAIPQFLFTYIMLWVREDRVVPLSEVSIQKYGLVFLPILLFLVSGIYGYVKKQSTITSEKLFAYVTGFAKMFMLLAGFIMLLALIHYIVPSTSESLANMLGNFLPSFYAELLYVAFVVLPVLIVKQKI